MHESLQKLFDQLELQRESALTPFRALSIEKLNHPPAAGRWSAAEVLSHIVAAEQLSVTYMKKKIEGIPQASRSGPWETVKMGVLIASQRLPGLKFKAPQRVVENTAVLTTLPEIEKAWMNIRTDLRALLERIPADRINRMIYKHPAAGYLNARHALVFFREHVIHHTPQLRKLLKQKPTPSL